jgi:hypothetical protein
LRRSKPQANKSLQPFERVGNTRKELCGAQGRRPSTGAQHESTDPPVDAGISVPLCGPGHVTGPELVQQSRGTTQPMLSLSFCRYV